MDNQLKKFIARKIIPPEHWRMADKTNFAGTLVPNPDGLHWKYGTVHQFIFGTPIMQQQNKVPKEWLPEFQESLKEVKKVVLTPLNDETEKNKIKQILSTDFKIQRLIAGNIEGYPSPSEARLSLLCCLAAYRLSDEAIFFVMNNTKGLNWHEKEHLQQREVSLARKYVKEERKVFNG